MRNGVKGVMVKILGTLGGDLCRFLFMVILLDLIGKRMW